MARSQPVTPPVPQQDPARPAESKDAPKPAPARPAESKDAPKPAPAKPAASQQVVPAVEVTGKRNANEDRRYSTASKIIINRDDIEQYGDTNLGEVMRRLPGVTQGGRPGRGGGIQMRGMGGGFTQILVDGERIPPGFSLEQITPEQVERIEILRAPTAETGARAIAGTINIILREALVQRHNDIRTGFQADRGKISPSISLSRNDTFATAGTYNMTLSTGRNDQLTDTRARTTYVDTISGVTELDQESFSQSHDTRNNLFLSGRLQWRLGPGEQLTIMPFITGNRARNEGRGTLTQLGGTDVPPYATSASDFDGRFNVGRIGGMLTKRINQDTRYELRGGVGRFSSNTDLVINQYSASGVRNLLQTTDSEATDRSWTTAGKLSHNLTDTVQMVGGFELEGVKRTENAVTLLNGALQLADFGSELNVSTRRTAAYLQGEWDPSPQWSSYLGVRWEGIETNSDSAGGLDNRAVRNNSRVLTPLAHGVWRFAAPQRDQIRVSLTQSYRSPGTQSLVGRPSLNTRFPVPGANTSITPDRAGNPFLKPELANGIDVAYESFLKSGGVVSVNLFSRRIRDLIRNVTSLETVSWAPVARYVSRPQNLGRATTSGIEFDAKFQLPELIDGAIPLNIRANASVFHSTVDEVKGPNNRIDQQPRGILNLGADYRFRATPFSVGGSFALTPAYETQQTNTQLQKLSTKRVVDAYVLWTINSATKLRLSLSNVAPRDLDTTTSIFEGSQLQTTVSNGRTDMSTALRLEMRL